MTQKVACVFLQHLSNLGNHERKILNRFFTPNLVRISLYINVYGLDLFFEMEILQSKVCLKKLSPAPLTH